MKSYRELDIYNDSKKYAIEVHKMILALPKFEQFEEAGQIRISSKSVAAMIVEGSEEKDIRPTLSNILFMHMRNVMKLLFALIFYLKPVR